MYNDGIIYGFLRKCNKLLAIFRAEGHNIHIPTDERNRTMKRLIAAILALALALTLTACNGKKKSASDSDLAAVPAAVTAVHA